MTEDDFQFFASAIDIDGDRVGLYACPECGALVSWTRTGQHIVWHGVA